MWGIEIFILLFVLGRDDPPTMDNPPEEGGRKL
jgi:hypothetical protein